MDWFLYGTDLRHERVKQVNEMNFVLEAYLEPCQISMMKIFAKIVNGFSQKSFFIDVWQGRQYAFGLPHHPHEIRYLNATALYVFWLTLKC